MLSSEFTNEIAALLRSMEAQVRHHPTLINADERDLLDSLDAALVALVAVRLKVQSSLRQK